jgi:hypothetical protein
MGNERRPRTACDEWEVNAGWIVWSDDAVVIIMTSARQAFDPILNPAVRVAGWV